MKKLNFDLVGLAALIALAGAACDEEESTLEAAVECQNLDYGEVAVTGSRDLSLTCTGQGQAPLQVDNIVITNPSNSTQATFSLPDRDAAIEALDGLRITETATVTVRFTPCEAALNNPAGIGQCTAGPVSGSITLLDNTRDASEFDLIGVAALPPNPSFRCVIEQGCGNSNPNNNFSDNCTQLNFGALGVEDGACDLYVEVTNSTRDGDAVAAFQIFDFDFNIFDGTASGDVPIEAEEAGFSVLAVDTLDENGNLTALPSPEPIRAGADDPWVVPGTESEETRFFVVRLAPTSAGTFLGQQGEGEGLIMTTNAADADSDGIENLGVLGTVQVPEIAVTCDGSQIECGDTIRFRDTDLNVESRRDCNVSQVGDGALDLTAVNTLVDDDEMGLQGLNPPVNNLQVQPFVISYTPVDGEPDRAVYELVSNDPGSPSCEIEVLGGDLPILQASPRNLFFSSLGMMRVCQNIEVENVGDATLTIEGIQVDVTEENQGSADDFFFTDETFPIELEQDQSETFEVCYENNDSSTVDAADLSIASDDPSSPELVALIAETDPCLPPVVNFTVNPISGRRNLCARGDNDLPGEGPDNFIHFRDSMGGGTSRADASIVACELDVVRGPLLVFDPEIVTVEDDLETRVEAFPFMGGGRPVVVEATCTNSCGSQNSAVENLSVFPASSPQCQN